MAITTVNGLLAGAVQPRDFLKSLTGTLVAGQPRSLFYLSGQPGAGTASVAGVNGEILTAPVSGAISFVNPSSGSTYLNGFGAFFTQAGTLWLCDRIWQNSGLDPTNTGEQSFTCPTLPARDRDGAATGTAYQAAIELTTAATANTPTITLKYTNTLGTPGQTATNIFATTATAAIGAFFPIAYAAGDVGVQLPQSVTFSASWTTAAVSLVVYRKIAWLGSSAANAYAFKSGAQMGWPKMYNNNVLFLVFIPNTTTTSNIGGDINWCQG
jgi:hypothetical protein